MVGDSHPITKNPGLSFLAPWALVGFLGDAGLLHVLLLGEELVEGHRRGEGARVL